MARDKKIGSKLGLLFWAVVFLCNLVFLVHFGREYMDSDMAAEVILATVKPTFPNFLINANWFYSTELRVINLQPLYAIGLFFSPHNWAIARAICMGIAYILASVAAWCLCRECDLKEYAEWFAGLMLCPISFWYQWQTIFGGFYLTYIIISLWALLALVKLTKAVKKSAAAVWWIILLVLALLSGMQGIRQGMILFVPLLPVAIWLSKRQEKFYHGALAAFLFYLIGLVVNIGILKNLYSFEANEQQTWGNGNGSWMLSFKWFLESFGFCQTTSYGLYNGAQDVKVMSLCGIGIGFGIVMEGIVLASMIFDIRKFKKLTEWEQMLVALTTSMIITICFVFTYMRAGSEYWQQTIPFGYLYILIAFRNLDLKGFKFKDYIIPGLAAIVSICSVATSVSFLKDTPQARIGVVNVVDFILNETDYRSGYASFWLAGTTQGISNGEIEMYSGKLLPDSLELDQWLQRKDHIETAPTSHYFILCYSNEWNGRSTPVLDDNNAVCIYDDGTYCVYAVD